MTHLSTQTAKSTVRFNKQRQNQVCIQQQRLIGLCLRRFNALLILDSPQTAQPTQASAFISTAVSYSQAGNTKTMETARMWHSEILLSRLVSLFLNKALHGVSGVHGAARSPSLCFPPSLSFFLSSPCAPLFFSSHWSLFISLCSSTQLAFFSPLCLCFFACFPLLSFPFLPHLSESSGRCCMKASPRRLKWSVQSSVLISKPWHLLVWLFFWDEPTSLTF